MTVSVGFIGLGNMGNPDGRQRSEDGLFPMTVFDKNPKAMENLVEAGAKAAASAARSWSVEVVLTCVPGSPESRRRISSRAASSSARSPATSSST